MISREAQSTLATIEERDMKAVFRDEPAYKAALAASEALGGKSPAPQSEWVEGVQVEKSTLGCGSELWRLSPSQGASTGARVLYIHGSGFVLPCGEPQWRFATALALKTGSEVSLVLYPLAPVATYKETCSAVMDAYETLLSQDPAHIVVAGDSAGGYLALACAHMSRERGLRAPDHVIALSPCIDFYDALEGREELDSADPLISLTGLRFILREWAPKRACQGVFPPDLWAASYDGLSPTTILVGSREVLLKDSLAYAGNAHKAGADVTLHVEEGMWHTYPLFMEMPEAADALKEIASIVQGV